MFSSLLTHTAIIKRASVTKGTQGQITKTWSEIASDIPCEIQDIKGDYIFQIGGEFYRSTHKAFFNTGVDIEPGDIVIANSTTYDVLDKNLKSGHHLELKLSYRYLGDVS